MPPMWKEMGINLNVRKMLILILCGNRKTLHLTTKFMKHTLFLPLMLCCLFCSGQNGNGIEIKTPITFTIPDSITTTISPAVNLLIGKNLFKDTLFSYSKDSVPIFIASWTRPLKIDTIPCVMLVTDTFQFDQYTTTYDTLVTEYGMKSISIGMKKSKTILNNVWQQQGYCINRSDSFYVTYLDADKKELPKSIIIWQSIIR